jgi:3-oxoacyl-[acyl-carrier protein] reductase
MRNNRLLEKVALITGAGRGIGSAITKKFSQEGAKVIINYNQSKKEATNLEKDIQKKGGEVISLKADVSNIEEVTFMIKNIINRFSRIDILVNNAGILFPATFNETTESIWDKTMDINIIDAFLCCKEVAPIMLKHGKGKIINISSICGLAERSALRNTAYAVSKAGLIGLTRSLAVNLGPKINVNAICPGLTETDMIKVLGKERIKAGADESILKRIGKPDEIANAVLFLASDESDFITGEILAVSGGRGLR